MQNLRDIIASEPPEARLTRECEAAAQEQAKTPGQRAYEADVAAKPNYDHDGRPRDPWSQLSEIAQWSWELNPTPRR